MILIRIVLISFIVYLIIRSFAKFGKEEETASRRKDPDRSNTPGKKVSKEIGEYVDYEEIDK